MKHCGIPRTHIGIDIPVTFTQTLFSGTLNYYYEKAIDHIKYAVNRDYHIPGM
jgi:hypothetical protein